MEKLKSIIPVKMRKRMEESNTDDLPSTCSSLHELFCREPLFHSTVKDLTNPELGFCSKNKDTAFQFKNRGNACFSSSNYSQAAAFYSQALRVATVDTVDKDNKLVAVLYVNRASSFYKMNRLEESLRDCKRALMISPRYAKAWYRRGKVNACLFNFEDAICDLKVALQVEETCSGKREIENYLLSITNQNETTNICKESTRKAQLVTDEVPKDILMCVCTPTKGRGMATSSEILPASLIHKEEPFAAIISKNFRDTNCHFCFNELPADYVPCTSCSIPLYCSEQCQLQAGGDNSRKCLTNKGKHVLSSENQEYIAKITMDNQLGPSTNDFAEHEHECHGVNWPVVLPAHVVLVGRIFMKLVKLRGISDDLDLSHNYIHIPPESKVELHVFGIILLYCLRSSNKFKVGLHGEAFAKVVILISQIKVNSMAIVRMKYANMCLLHNQSKLFSQPTDFGQARVGQAIYLSGSLFNHSCMPNIHAYFISRTLLIRATELVLPGCPLEMSYGPQVGQWDYRKRQEFLLDNYSFRCECSACTRVNLPDLVLNAFRCAKPNCSGVILDNNMVEFEKHKVCQLQNTSGVHSMELRRQVDQVIDDELKNIACLLLECYNSSSVSIQSGCCLKCGHTSDVKSLNATFDKADTCIRSLQESVTSNEVLSDLLLNALSALQDLKSMLHAYNKKLAEAEDILAEAFCSVGEIQRAINHCTESIEILKKLYSPGHIALGNELIKLSSLQIALGDAAAIDSVNQMNTIFSNYYGMHAELLLPYLQDLKREVRKLT